MDYLNIITTVLEAARQLPERTGVDGFYLILGGLVSGLIGTSILITLLVWLRYLVGVFLVVIIIMGFNHWRRQVCVDGEESDMRNEAGKKEALWAKGWSD
jgi:hypothetical protein